MIYPRLYLARNLLKEDGFIFISIDDNEYARLKLICDEIFGEKNFVANIIWRKKNTGGGSSNSKIDIETEYILVYSKNFNFCLFSKKEVDIKKYTLKDEYEINRGKYKLEDLDHICSKNSFQYIESLDYLIQAPDGTYFKNYRNIKNPKSYCYTLGKDTFNFFRKNDFIFFKKNYDGFWKAYKKSYEKVKIDIKKLEIVPRSNGNPFNNIIDSSNDKENQCFESSITSSRGTRDLINILNQNIFPHPKPIDLIKYLINFHPNKNALVLDFFAGSGTTGQAVMELNKEDDGNRNFILVQLEEKIDNNLDYKNIAEITIDRIKKSIEKYEYEKDKKFKVFKVKDSNFKDFVAENIDGQIQLNIKEENFGPKEDTKDLSLIYEIILSKNYELNVQCEQKKENNINYWLISDKLLIFLDSKNKNTIDYSKVFLLIESYWNSLDDEIKKVGITIIFNDRYFIDDQSKVNLFLEINNLSDQIKIEVF